MLVECKIHDFRANLAAHRGDLVTAEWEIRRAMDTAELTGYPASMAASGLARILSVTGRHEEAAATLAAIEVPSEDLPLLHVARSNGLGVAALAEGRWEEGVEHLQHAWNAAEKLGMGDLRALPFRNDLVEGLIRVGRIADAAAAADRIDELAARSGAPTAVLHAGRARMQVLVAEGRHGDAVVLGRRLQALAEDHVVPMDLCRILQVLGSAQRRSGQRREALVTLTRARAVAVELGAVVWRDRIDEELARLGGRRDPYELDVDRGAGRRARGHGPQQPGGRQRAGRQRAHRRVEPDEDLPQAGHAVAGRAGRRVADEQEGGPAVADPPSRGAARSWPVGSMAGRWDLARTARMCPPHPAAPGLTMVRHRVSTT